MVMFPNAIPPMKATRYRLWASLVAGGVMCASSAAAQPPAQPMQQATAAPAARVFGSNTGVVLNFIKPDKTADFEAVLAKLKDALQNSSNDQRKQQAASWKVYKSPDPGPGGSVLYVYIVDPVIKGADYAVTTILAEAFSPEELAALNKRYTEAYATGQNIVNLNLVSDLGK
jgi:hypothetical protein